jgi:two-component system chemotaxis response regulator CheY
VTRKVLVIDDSEAVREQVRAALAGAGFEVLQAADGTEGLDTICSCEDLRAVLCDINMPRMSGLDMLERAKERGHLPKLPVVMLTTEDQPGLVERAKAVGARGWIVKPFKPEHVVSTIRKLTAHPR